MDTLQSSMDRLARWRRVTRLYQIAALVALLCAIPPAIADSPLTAVGGLCALALLLLMRRSRKRQSEVLARAQTMLGFCTPLGQPRYLDRSAWTRDEFAALQLLPIRLRGNSFLCLHGFSGRLGSVTVTGGEVTFHCEAAGRRGRYRFFSGTLLRGDAGAAGQDWLILNSDFLNAEDAAAFTAQAGYEPRTQERLDEISLRLFCKAGSDLPDEGRLRRIVALAREEKRLAAVRLNARGMTLFLDHCFYTGELPRDAVQPRHITASLLPSRTACFDLLRYAGSQ